MTQYKYNLPHSFIPLAELAILKGRSPNKKEWKTWVLETSAGFKYINEPEHLYVIVEDHFMTDFASIPWFLRWWKDGNMGPQRIAGYFHDWLYSSQDQYSRKESDRIFRLVMKGLSKSKIAFFVRWFMWTGLRMFGWLAWKKNRRMYENNVHWRILK